MPVHTLDYPGARIQMEVTNDIEEGWRLHGVKKEPWTAAFIESMPPGAAFWDVGANVGSYALIAAARGHQVVAIEPGFANYAALCQNLALNGLLHQAIIFPCVVAAATGFVWFHYTDIRRGGASHIIGGPRKQTHHRQLIETQTLDGLAAKLGSPGPHFVKIDVDGGELDVLAGGAAFLSSPAVQGVIIEMHPAEEEEIIKRLNAYGLVMTGRFNERDGVNIGIAYGEFRRPV